MSAKILAAGTDLCTGSSRRSSSAFAACLYLAAAIALLFGSNSAGFHFVRELLMWQQYVRSRAQDIMLY